MTTVNVHEAKTHFSELLDRAAHGETITIAKAGRPVARLVPLEVVTAARRRLGFLAGRLRVPDDFDRMGEEQIAVAFRGEHRDICWTPTCCFEQQRAGPPRTLRCTKTHSIGSCSLRRGPKD